MTKYVRCVTMAAVMLATQALHAAGVDIYVDDLWVSDGTNVTLRVTDVTTSDVFEVQTVGNLISDTWNPIYTYAFGYGYGYGYGDGFSYSASFGYGYGYGYDGYGYRPILLWTGSYTNSGNKIFYRIMKQ